MPYARVRRLDRSILQTQKPAVDLVCEPTPYTLRHNKRAALRVVNEFHERSGDYNVGGSSQQKLMTAYREKSLHCAYLMREHGPLSPRKLRDLTNNKAVSSLLQKLLPLVRSPKPRHLSHYPAW